MRKQISEIEIIERIELNHKRLETAEYYQIDRVFSPESYDWYGDMEGRALLAFVSHYKASGKKISCMDAMMKLFPDKLNEKGFLGKIFENVIHEQQLSGHSWLLRGLCEYYEQFSDDMSLDMIRAITNNLYLPLTGKINTYPVVRKQDNDGGVSGNSNSVINGWQLSSDIGCAFMSIDGLSHAYKVTKDLRIKTLLDEMISMYMSIDKVKINAQTHCTLTAARGMIRMYQILGDKNYLSDAQKIYDLYVYGNGITYTYHNINWWGRPDTWSEPCAIIDSLMLATELFKETGENKYRTFAARVYHNAFSTLQRENGSAGPDTTVCDGSNKNYIEIHMYDAWFCCSMRLAEGLWYIKENIEYLFAECSGKVTKNENGVYMDGDIIYCIANDNIIKNAEVVVDVDGIKLCPIIKMWKIPEKYAYNIKMQIVC